MGMPNQTVDAGMRGLLARIQADASAAAGTGYDPAGPGLAGASLGARIEAHLGQLAHEYTAAQRKAGAELARRLRAVAPVWLPPVPFKPVAGVLAVDPAGRTSSADFAPQDGYAWFLTHLAVAGLAGAGAGSATGLQTLSSYATVTNPGAGATITSLALPAGTWNLGVFAGFSGTLTAADSDNMQLTVPSGGPFTLVANIASASSAENPTLPFTVVIPSGGGTVAVKAIAAASGASANYRAAIYATASTSGGDAVSLYKVGATLNNYLHGFSSASPDWVLGAKSVFLLPDDVLVLAGTGLVSSQILLTGQAVQVELPLIADYLN